MNKQVYFSFHDSTLGFSLERALDGLEDFSLQEILPRVYQLESKGYEFLQSWSMGFRSPDRVVFPDKRIMDLEELFSYEKASDGDIKKSQEAKEALEYFWLVDSYPYDDKRHDDYASFLDLEDEQTARDKYNSKLAA